ncbi:cell division protein PerM [Pedococcus sp. 5OH_020]|uniref:cell division protein PerM n=1 Tax=Pedococcus sp. 5OH_020 TaxID=2989814 RepID=UPI0022E9ED9F|nr:DUF6350 family protein [Pedococcus sp. 5OH_020]
MSVMELLRGATSTRQDPDDLRALRRALLAGAGTAAFSALVFVLPALVVWVATPQSSVPWTAALGVGSSLWLLGTGAHLTTGGGHVTVVPLLFLALALVGGSWAAYRAGAEAAGDRTVRLVRDLVHVRLAMALGAWAAGYAVCAAAWALVALLAGPRPVGWTLLGPVLVVPACSALAALSRWVRRRPMLAGPSMRRPRWLPEAVRRALRPGFEGAAVLLGAGVSVCLLLVLLRFSTVSHLQSELAPGLLGGVVLAAAQALLLPNLALWAVSFAAGTGFSAVEGASATWTGSRTALMPMVPVLGALPEPGAFPGVMPVVVLVPVAVGAFVGWRGLRSVARLSTQRTKLVVVGTAVLVTALSLGTLDAVAGGSLGTARLSHVGAPAGAMTVALLLELAVGAGLVLAWDRWKLRR